ncbi:MULTISPECIES: LysE family translocator [Bacillus]|uniref:LysE family transporter n=3 Tax=Bacillus toyonensis TaxID=155322 RepID=A0ABX6G9F4_9BACI|nr:MULTISPECIES: LysE family translocator [Bacillus]AFU12985.1 Homoserine/threonine efflux protein [Bacillus thuringiensis MC28]EEL34669.1 Homoserine/threonine efflux protein [Bacillus cereus Rock3-28]EEL40583.1 Homoserine/threonine efflux protein [Bacillus cereus Rock3-29]KAB0449136.1 LysE family translocator [Lysinibacillus sp. VIA-II-2016]KNH37723.1 lysine transporter LysE [Bacillus thuringiensis]KXY14484.1 lysine transporter LysE [Bacillus cereus]MDH8708243.1 RhtB (resistance to homoseri
MIENYLLFIIMSICLIILPGPDTAMATKNTLVAGKMGGVKTVFGTCVALLIHTLAAVIGLSALIVKSALLFSIFKYVGALYLIYIGIKALLAVKNKEGVNTNDVSINNDKEHTSCFRQGFLTNLLNPKIAVFFLTFLPQFLNPSHNTFIQLLVMGLTYLVLTIIWFAFYIFLIDKISAFMKKPKTQRYIQGLTGIVLIGFGIKLALEKNN